MKIIGITGGIGSGKSAVSKLIEEMGYPVFYADSESKKILASHPFAISEIIKVLGNNSYFPNGEPNKTFIADKIFNNDELLNSINKILHPLVKTAFDEFVKAHTASELVFHEAALIYQAGFDKFMDSIIFVSCSESIRVQRVLQRDNLTEVEIRKRIKAQGDWLEFEKKSTFVIKNEGTISELESEVKNVINRIKQHV